VTRLSEILHRDLIPRRHTALLVAIIATVAVRPLIGDVGFAPAAFSIALLVVLFVALFTIQVDDLVGERAILLVQRRRRRMVGWTLAALALTERVVLLISPNSELYRVGAVSWLLFFAFVTWSQLRSLLKQKEVTNETISMSISVYLLLGLTWGLLYIVIFQFQPEAFNLGSSPGAVLAPQHEFPIIIYFSLTTLSTVGFGDITPLTLQARYAAVAEGITGQFYLAILVARLVALHMNRSIAQEQAAAAVTPEAEPAVEGDR
jgi:hypothetical protein